MSTHNPARVWLNKHEIAERFGVAVRTVDAWMARGLLPYFKPGASKQAPVRFNLHDVEAALAKFNRNAR